MCSKVREVLFPGLKTLFLACLLYPSNSIASEPAPLFAAKNLLSDNTISLSDYTGKVVYLDFWATWCAPCREALPAYDKLRRELGTEQFEIIGVNIDSPTSLAIDYLKQHPVDFPLIADPDGDIAKRYGLRVMPSSFLIDQEGKIVLRKKGYEPGDEFSLKTKIRHLLN